MKMDLPIRFTYMCRRCGRALERLHPVKASQRRCVCGGSFCGCDECNEVLAQCRAGDFSGLPRDAHRRAVAWSPENGALFQEPVKVLALVTAMSYLRNQRVRIMFGIESSALWDTAMAVHRRIHADFVRLGHEPVLYVLQDGDNIAFYTYGNDLLTVRWASGMLTFHGGFEHGDVHYRGPQGLGKDAPSRAVDGA